MSEAIGITLMFAAFAVLALAWILKDDDDL